MAVRSGCRTGLAQTDAQYVRYWKQEWLVTDFSRSSVDFSRSWHGGPPKDGIPPIDEPAFVSVTEADGFWRTGNR